MISQNETEFLKFIKSHGFNEIARKLLLRMGIAIGATLYVTMVTCHHHFPGMGSSRTVLDLEDSSRTKMCGLGLGLGLEAHWPWPWP